MAQTTEGIFTVVILVYYLFATIVSAFWPPAKVGVDHVKPTKPPAWTLLRKAQLIASVFVVASCITTCVLRGIVVGRISKDADPELVSNLFFALAWTVLSLGLFDFPRGPTFPHYGSWALSLLSQILNVTQHFTQPTLLSPKVFVFEVIIQSFSVALVFALLAGTVLIQHTGGVKESSGEADETQPLLADEGGSDQKKANKVKEPDEDEKARKELRDRPFWTYVRSFKVYLPFMFPSTIQQRGYFVGVCICTAISRVVNITRPLALGAVVNGLLPFHSVPWGKIGIYVFLHYLDSAAGISLLQEFLKYRLTNEQKLALNRAAYDHIMNLSADFHDSKRSSHIWQSMFQARSVISLFHDLLFGVTPSFIDLFAGISVLWALFGPYMGFVVATTVVVFIWMTAKALGSKADMQRTYQEAWHEEMDQLVDSSYNWKAVSEFGQIPYEMQRFRAKGRSTQTAQEKITYFNYATRGARYTVLVLAFLAASCLAAIEIAHGERLVGDFVVLTSYWGQLTGPLNRLVSEVNETTNKLVDAEKLLILLEKKPSVQNDENAKPFEYHGGQVDFENVSFSYDGKREVSESVSFRAPAGTTTALVGETGGGKSTLLKLLFRFYDAKEGRIFIDGQDVKSMTMESFRKHIAIVPQDPALFNTTVLENIRYPDPSLSEEEVQEACKAVALHDKILTFSKGYNEKVGERGVRLSGGELQRLAIARAILKKPDMLLLDEATSSVDSMTEAQIQASLDELCKGKTTFVIAHRLSTILKADQILVVKGGKMVEAGTHSELLLKKGAYNELWTSQLKLQEDVEKASKSPEKKGGLTLINNLRKSEEETQNLVKNTNEKLETVEPVEPVEACSSAPVSSTKETSVKDDASSTHSHEHQAHDVSHALTNGHDRSPAKQMVQSFKRRLSSPKSAMRATKPRTAVSSHSPSRLNGDAPAFIPQKAQQDGAADEQTSLLIDHASVLRGRRRETKSEPMRKADDDSTDESDTASEEDGGEVKEDKQGKYSRIPKRSK